MRKKKKEEDATRKVADSNVTNQPPVLNEENTDSDLTESPDIMQESEQAESAGQEADSDASESADSSEVADSSEESEKDSDDEMMSAFEAWLEDSIDDDERREIARDAMSQIQTAFSNGKFDDLVFEVIAKGADYDRAILEAEEAGEIRGRNATIEDLTRDCDDDGIPHPGSNGGGNLTGRVPSIFDLARDAY